MSYNTRRTGGGPGRTAPSTQVNYHQQPNRPASNPTQSRNPGYTTTQQPVTYSSSAQPAYTTQPAFTTPPILPSSQPKTVPQTQPPATIPAPSANQPALPITPRQPVTSSVKIEPITPETPKPETTENGEATTTAKKPFWKKKPFLKVSNKVRKARQNAKLRRILNPKNALTFLNELRPGGVKFVVCEEGGWGYTASVKIDGQKFSGHALSVTKAKVQASEQALKHLMLEQLSKSQQSAPASTDTDSKEKQDADESMETETSVKESSSEQGSGEPKTTKPRVQPEDDVPWGSLAAFALHKLFSEWQKEAADTSKAFSETFTQEKLNDGAGDDPYFTRRPTGGPPGFEFPRRALPPYPSRGFGPYPPPRGPPPPGFGLPPRRPPLPPPPAASFLSPPAKPASSTAGVTMQPMKKIPEDANQRHPVMLLNQLKPNVVYNEAREGAAPRVFFVISAEIDGKEYIGRGRNKKEAKKQAAKAALASIGIICREED